jgi:preprotein translocase subunit Sec61beta
LAWGLKRDSGSIYANVLLLAFIENKEIKIKIDPARKQIYKNV